MTLIDTIIAGIKAAGFGKDLEYIGDSLPEVGFMSKGVWDMRNQLISDAEADKAAKDALKDPETSEGGLLGGGFSGLLSGNNTTDNSAFNIGTLNMTMPEGSDMESELQKLKDNEMKFFGTPQAE